MKKKTFKYADQNKHLLLSKVKYLITFCGVFFTLL